MLSLVLLVAACTSSSGTSSTSGAGGTGGGAGGAAGGSACPNPPALTAPSPACNTVTNGASAIPFTPGTGTPPVPAGGTVLDGVYYATNTSGYGSNVTQSGRKLTIVILGGGTQMLWAGEVRDATGATPTLSFTANATASISGTQIAMSVTCMSTAQSPLPAALSYTATANQLVLSLTTNGATAVTTYTRQGCP
jgi:hypothetical protein